MVRHSPEFQLLASYCECYGVVAEVTRSGVPAFLPSIGGRPPYLFIPMAYEPSQIGVLMVELALRVEGVA